MKKYNFNPKSMYIILLDESSKYDGRRYRVIFIIFGYWVLLFKYKLKIGLRIINPDKREWVAET